MYINAFQTDLTEATPSTLIWDPLSTDADAFNKQPLWWRHGRMPATGSEGAMFNFEFDIKAKRKLGADMELCLVHADQLGSTITYQLLVRCLLMY